MHVEQEAFLAAIRSQPLEAAPRLIYADWLEDRGHPLADLIRAEVALSELNPLTPEYWSAKAHARELRKTVPDGDREPLGYGDSYLPMLSRLPADRVARWRLLDRFVDYWDSTTGPTRGFSGEEIDAAEERLKLKFPAAVREFFQLHGRRVSGRKNLIWMTPSSCEVSRRRLVFRRVISDMYGEAHWSVPLDWGDDPPVRFGAAGRPGGGESSLSFSAFAALTLFRQAVYGAPFRAESSLIEYFPDVCRRLRRCDLPYRYNFDATLRFCEGRNIVCELVEGLGLEFGALSRNAFRQLPKDLLLPR